MTVYARDRAKGTVKYSPRGFSFCTHLWVVPARGATLYRPDRGGPEGDVGKSTDQEVRIKDESQTTEANNTSAVSSQDGVLCRHWSSKREGKVRGAGSEKTSPLKMPQNNARPIMPVCGRNKEDADGETSRR